MQNLLRLSLLGANLHSLHSGKIKCFKMFMIILSLRQVNKNICACQKKFRCLSFRHSVIQVHKSLILSSKITSHHLCFCYESQLSFTFVTRPWSWWFSFGFGFIIVVRRQKTNNFKVALLCACVYFCTSITYLCFVSEWIVSRWITYKVAAKNNKNK